MTTDSTPGAEQGLAPSAGIHADHGVAWRVAGAVVQGRSHVESGVPCQDAISSWASGGKMIVAVADGAGSAKLSHLGSEAAVRAAVEWFIATDRFTDVVNLFQAARVAVEELSFVHNAEFREFATTLAVAVCWGDGQLTTAQVGDGIVAVQQAGSVEEGAAPLGGEFANEAVFLTSGAGLAAFSPQSHDLAHVRGVALSSDGLYLVATRVEQGRKPFPPFFQDCFTAVRNGAGDSDIEAFLENVQEKTGDDKSLLIAVLEDVEDLGT